MEPVWQHIGFTGLNWAEVARVVVRLSMAVVMGGIIGFDRELHRRSAGLRTHMLITLGAASFMLLAMELTEQVKGDPTRVVQGVMSGIGFLGAGTVIKLTDLREVKGLTTASGIWSAAAIGVAVGAGWFTLAITGTVLTLAVMVVLRVLERGEEGNRPKQM